MTEQTEQPCVWPFAECYKEAFGGLPPSQQREAVKRLTSRRRNPLTAEQCAEPSPEILACLEAVQKAYLSKKLRSSASSATKRLIQKSHPEPAEVEPEPEPEALADAIAAVSLEPATIVAEEPAPEPTPTPEPSPVPRSKPIPIPAPAKPLPVARAPAATPMHALALPAQPPKPTQKSGLGAMLKR